MAKKRANGEGSIRKRKDDRWEGRYTAGHDPETGRAIYKNVLGRTQAEVKEKLKAAIKETQALDQTKVGKYTVGEWMEVWFEDYAKIKVRPSSHQTYRGHIDNHISPTWENGEAVKTPLKPKAACRTLFFVLSAAGGFRIRNLGRGGEEEPIHISRSPACFVLNFGLQKGEI